MTDSRNTISDKDWAKLQRAARERDQFFSKQAAEQRRIQQEQQRRRKLS